MRLNGWQHIGIVASVIWAIGTPIYLDHAARQEALDAFGRCYEALGMLRATIRSSASNVLAGPMMLCRVTPCCPLTAL